MKLLAVVGVCAFVSLIEARVQSVGVRGTLMCGQKPLNNTVVKLWDEDSFFDPDDLLACVKTDAQGRFELQGFEDETTNIDPRLKIYTDCNDRTLFGIAPKPCQRKIKMKIPSSYINSGRTVTRWFDAGIMNMELKQRDEERKCSIFELC
uniref:Transthyretin-like family protein n=1 Tax=Plectus sambesii TaxID=2011161 RepID=A0A914UYK0_9BILA